MASDTRISRHIRAPREGGEVRLSLTCAEPESASVNGVRVQGVTLVWTLR